MRTRFGRSIYAVGATATRLLQEFHNPVKVQLQAFLIKGFITGPAGISLTLMTASGNPLQAEAWPALAIGLHRRAGFGGWGSMASAVYGAGFLVLIQSAVVLLLRSAVPTDPWSDGHVVLAKPCLRRHYLSGTS